MKVNEAGLNNKEPLIAAEVAAFTGSQVAISVIDSRLMPTPIVELPVFPNTGVIPVSHPPVCTFCGENTIKLPVVDPA